MLVSRGTRCRPRYKLVDDGKDTGALDQGLFGQGEKIRGRQEQASDGRSEGMSRRVGGSSLRNNGLKWKCAGGEKYGQNEAGGCSTVDAPGAGCRPGQRAVSSAADYSRLVMALVDKVDSGAGCPACLAMVLASPLNLGQVQYCTVVHFSFLLRQHAWTSADHCDPLPQFRGRPPEDQRPASSRCSIIIVSCCLAANPAFLAWIPSFLTRSSPGYVSIS